MKENNSMERVLIALMMGVFMTWLRPFVAVDLWAAHIVPMGLPPVDFWWMFWALCVTGVLHASQGAKSDRALSESMMFGAVNAVFILVIWMVLT